VRILIVLLLLQGCALHEQMIADRISAKGPTCEKLGFQKDTDPYRQCQIQLYQTEQANSAAAIGLIQQSRPVTCRTVGNTTNCY
jgi:hypothetical protein